MRPSWTCVLIASFGDFFRAPAAAGLRPVDSAPDAIVSPCDGVVAAAGHADGGALIQAKGKTTRSRSSSPTRRSRRASRRRVRDDLPVAARLSPRARAGRGALVDYDYVPGALWPVNPRVAERRDRLLSRNERVVIELEAGRAGASRS